MAWTDSATGTAKQTVRTFAPSADSWGNLGDASTGTARQTVDRFAPSADNWGNLADSTPAYTYGQLYSLAADPWANLADAVLAPAGIPLAFSDPWQALADSLAVLEAFLASPSSDAWGILGDSATGTGVLTVLTFGPSEDSWATLADVLGIAYTASLTASLAADPWETLSDALVDILGLLAVPAPDANAAYSDALAEFYGLILSPSADDASANWGDSFSTVEALLASPAVDSWATLSDALALFLAMLGGWRDALAIFEQLGVGGGPVLISVSTSDSWALLSDTQPSLLGAWSIGENDVWTTLADALAVSQTGAISVSPAADANAAYADSTQNILGLLLIPGTDANSVYGDGLAILYPLPVPLSADANAAYGDNLSLFQAYLVTETDQWNILADLPLSGQTENVDLPVLLGPDDMVLYADGVGYTIGCVASVTDANAAYTDLVSAAQALMAQVSDANAPYGESILASSTQFGTITIYPGMRIYHNGKVYTVALIDEIDSTILAQKG